MSHVPPYPPTGEERFPFVPFQKAPAPPPRLDALPRMSSDEIFNAIIPSGEFLDSHGIVDDKDLVRRDYDSLSSTLLAHFDHVAEMTAQLERRGDADGPAPGRSPGHMAVLQDRLLNQVRRDNGLDPSTPADVVLDYAPPRTAAAIAGLEEAIPKALASHTNAELLEDIGRAGLFRNDPSAHSDVVRATHHLATREYESRGRDGQQRLPGDAAPEQSSARSDPAPGHHPGLEVHPGVPGLPPPGPVVPPIRGASAPVPGSAPAQTRDQQVPAR